MTGTIQIGRLFGVPIRIHLSWLLVFVLVAWSLANGYFPANYPWWRPPLYWMVGLTGSGLLFTSVVVHELSHSLVAISRGYHVKGITLFILGGVSEIEKEANKASEEFLIAVVGPVTSFILSGLFFGMYFLLAPGGNEQLLALSFYLGFINLILGLFNLIPGFPMDGGRMLRSTIWKLTGSLPRATRIAANVGMAIGVLFIAAGALIAFSGNVFAGLWLAFIGWFIQSSASDAKTQQRVALSLADRIVSDAMSRQFPTVTPGTSLQELVSEHIARDFQRAFVVMLGEHFYGLITASDVRKVPFEQWASTPVTAVMTQVEGVVSIRTVDPLEEALRLLAGHGIHQLVVVSDGRPVGLVTRAHVLSILDLTDLVARSPRAA